jgi:hypothetical protein
LLEVAQATPMWPEEVALGVIEAPSEHLVVAQAQKQNSI